MKIVYPITIEIDQDGKYLVDVPDFKNHTFGKDLADALFMAEDMICILAVCMLDEGVELPEASSLEDLPQGENIINTLVMADISAYKAKYDNRAIRKNLTIPNWLNTEAENAGLNFSHILQEALKERLGHA